MALAGRRASGFTDAPGARDADIGRERAKKTFFRVVTAIRASTSSSESRSPVRSSNVGRGSAVTRTTNPESVDMSVSSLESTRRPSSSRDAPSRPIPLSNNDGRCCRATPCSASSKRHKDKLAVTASPVRTIWSKTNAATRERGELNARSDTGRAGSPVVAHSRRTSFALLTNAIQRGNARSSKVSHHESGVRFAAIARMISSLGLSRSASTRSHRVECEEAN
mmetsp:Transcript_35762/g.110233  ORF Transcript_35762/g.110233 Transcript_35762/m.110233 type:complete len:223 (-) Transcript_35762:1015-1683(-)